MSDSFPELLQFFYALGYPIYVSFTLVAYIMGNSVLGQTLDLKREESLPRVSSLLGFNKLCFTFTIFSHLQGESAAPGQSDTNTAHSVHIVDRNNFYWCL